MNNLPNGTDTLEPVAEDMSIHLLPGRVDTAAPAIPQAEQAERLGFKRIWIPERYSNKELGPLLGAIAARTTRLGVGSGPLSIKARFPIVLASMFATLQSIFGGQRVTLGIGRGGPHEWFPHFGFNQATYDELLDYVYIIKRLWAGERIEHVGPAGDFRGLEIADKTPGPPPEVCVYHMGGPKASKIAANPLFDSVALCNIVCAEGDAESIEITRKEAERVGRDPSTLKFIAPVTTAPDMSEEETLNLIGGRIIIYLQMPGLGERLRVMNRWSLEDANRIRNHPYFSEMKTALIDQSFRRAQLLEVAKLIPESWLRQTGGVGSSAEVVKMLQQFKDAGADEITLYGSTPAENAEVLRLWRQRPEAPKAQRGEETRAPAIPVPPEELVEVFQP